MWEECSVSGPPGSLQLGADGIMNDRVTTPKCRFARRGLWALTLSGWENPVTA